MAIATSAAAAFASRPTRACLRRARKSRQDTVVYFRHEKLGYEIRGYSVTTVSICFVLTSCPGTFNSKAGD